MVNRILMAGLAFTLIGCQGQNPFKRESNPLRNYPNAVAQGNQPYVPGQRPVAPKADLGGVAAEAAKRAASCFEPVEIKVKPDTGTQSMRFAEEVESSYFVELTLNGAQNTEMKIGRPQDSGFDLVSRAENTFVYKFTWKPKQGQSANKEKLTVGFEGEKPKGSCKTAANKAEVELLVAKTNDVPSVTFKDFKAKITFGEEFDFAVIVEDPRASAGNFPAVRSVSPPDSKKTLDVSKAVTKCKPGRQIEAQKFEFICHFDSNQLDNVDAFLNKGVERRAGMNVNAISRAGVKSMPTPVNMTIVFEKVETISAPLPPPRPKDLAVQGETK